MLADSSRIGGQFETVHTVSDFYDGPRGGIADYNGQPHIYKALCYHGADAEIFWLQPIDDETFRLAMESWAIWCRWELAFHRSETTQETHPALPRDRGRHNELEALLEAKLQIDPTRAFQRKG